MPSDTRSAFADRCAVPGAKVIGGFQMQNTRTRKLVWTVALCISGMLIAAVFILPSLNAYAIFTDDDNFTVNIVTDGVSETVTTSGGTVEQVLAEADIALSENDFVTPGINAHVDQDSVITVMTSSVTHRVSVEAIPYETVTLGTGEGDVTVLEEGQNGLKIVVYEIKTFGGVEYYRTAVSEEIVRPAQTRTVYQGPGGVLYTPDGQRLVYNEAYQMKATAYTTERQSNKLTASGTIARVGAVAVDRRVIPLGSKLYITSLDGKSWIYGVAVAEDTGVKGKWVDLFFDTYRECINFGVQQCKVYVLE